MWVLLLAGTLERRERWESDVRKVLVRRDGSAPGFLLLVLVSVALAGCQTEPVGTGEFTTFGITSYKVDPDQVDAFISAVHSDKMQQMGDDVSTMTSGYILR